MHKWELSKNEMAAERVTIDIATDDDDENSPDVGKKRKCEDSGKQADDYLARRYESAQFAWTGVRDDVGELIRCLTTQRDCWADDLANAQLHLKEREEKVKTLEETLEAEKATLKTEKQGVEEKRERLSVLRGMYGFLLDKEKEMYRFTKPSSWVRDGKWINVDELMRKASDLKSALMHFIQYLWGGKKALGMAIGLLRRVDGSLLEQLAHISRENEDAPEPSHV